MLTVAGESVERRAGVIKSIHHRHTWSSNDQLCCEFGHSSMMNFNTPSTFLKPATTLTWENFPLWYHPSKRICFFSLWSHDHFHQLFFFFTSSSLYFMYTHFRKESRFYFETWESTQSQKLKLKERDFSWIWNKTPCECPCWWRRW